MAESKIVPNTFQTPNVLVDDLMRLMTGDEVKCYLVIVRKTFGWMKRTDRIAKSQIMELTGLSEGTVDDCLKSLVKYNIVKRVSENNPIKNFGVEWEIQTDDSAIYYGALQGRYNDKAAVNARRTAKMRAGGGYVAQPQVVRHTQGGDVAQPPQKPLSKATEEKEESAEVFKFYGNNIELLTQYNSLKLGDMIDEYSPAWVLEALKDCVEYGARNLKYADAILRGWKAKGFRSDTRSKAKAKKQGAPNQPAQRIPAGV